MKTIEKPACPICWCPEPDCAGATAPCTACRRERPKRGDQGQCLDCAEDRRLLDGMRDARHAIHEAIGTKEEP